MNRNNEKVRSVVSRGLEQSKGQRLSTTIAANIQQKFMIGMALLLMLLAGGAMVLSKMLDRHQQQINNFDRSIRQYMVTDRASLLAHGLVLENDSLARDSLRIAMLAMVERVEKLHDEQIHSMPIEALPVLVRTVFFERDMVDQRVHAYLDALRTLSETPDAELNPEHPSIQFISEVSYGSSTIPPDAMVDRIVASTEKVGRLTRVVGIAIVIVSIAGFLFVALFVLRPLVADVAGKTQQLELVNSHLAELSATDPLTGIGNRRSFDERIVDEWARGIRNDSHLCLLMVDVDHFKAYNDKYHHVQGDNVLSAIGAVLRDTVNRSVDFAARYGGEEFAVILPNTSLDGGMEVGERIRTGVMDLKIDHEESPDGAVTVSVGVASELPSADLDPDSLVVLADKALYDAKHLGRNVVKGFERP
ncbi:MAG: GGDEF domain-containing protein [Gemmatimonadota bacterium]|nr:GGDEF domain-containing protein [Gemmatimonadota bacterium]